MNNGLFNLTALLVPRIGDVPRHGTDTFRPGSIMSCTPLPPDVAVLVVAGRQQGGADQRVRPGDQRRQRRARRVPALLVGPAGLTLGAAPELALAVQGGGQLGLDAPAVAVALDAAADAAAALVVAVLALQPPGHGLPLPAYTSPDTHETVRR